jgi:hypothetical protein
MKVEEIKQGNVVIKIHQGLSGCMDESPREWCNLGNMICFHNRYNLGDKHNLSIDELHDILENEDVIYLPLYLYDHSGITMSTSRAYPFNCSWDSGQVGYIYVTKDQIRKEYGYKYITKKRERFIVDILRGEVKIYDQYLTGDVYGFNVECEKCGEILDSCWGFYGQEWKENGLLDHAENNHICPNCDISGLLAVNAAKELLQN